MYIFELISELIKKYKTKPPKIQENDDESINCEHVFLPVDSTKRVLACTKCGIIIKNEEKNGQ